jgi:hypothetical protein
MNIPSLPADSIYKFSAFAGLATILFCIYTYTSLNETIQEKRMKVHLDLKRTEIELKFLKLKLEDLDAIKNSMTKGITASDMLKKGKTPIPVTTDEFKTKMREVGLLLHDNDIKNVELGIFIQELIALESRRSSYFAIASVGITIGVALAIWGFALWYVKIQRYQDQIIRNDSEKSKTISP